MGFTLLGVRGSEDDDEDDDDDDVSKESFNSAQRTFPSMPKGR